MPSNYSYWGMNPESEAEYVSPNAEPEARLTRKGLVVRPPMAHKGLAGLIAQRHDELVAGTTDLIEQAAAPWHWPSTDELLAEREQAAKEGEDTILWNPEAGTELLTTVIDNMTPSGALGTIARAKAGEMLDEAVKLTKKGHSPQEVAQATGMYTDRVGNWKTQIPDDQAEVAQHVARDTKVMTDLDLRRATRAGGKSYELRTVLKHDKLAEYNPEVFKVGKVKVTEDVRIGAMNPQFDMDGNLVQFQVMVNPKGIKDYAQRRGISYDEAFRSVVLHETQHGIQVLDKLPGGTNHKWMAELKKDQGIYRAHLKELEDVYSQLPKASQRAAEIKREIAATKSHVELVESMQNLDGQASYRHSIGEGDAFWTETMSRDPDVASKIPSHEMEMPRMNEYGNQLPLQPQWMNVTDSRHPFAMTPEGAAAAGPDVRASSSLLKALKGAHQQRRAAKQSQDIDVGHTSPAEFTEFNKDYAFTGEGAQGFGAGHYMWSNPKVGQHYKNMFDDRLAAEVGGVESQIRGIEQQLAQPRGVSNQEAKTLRSKIAELKESIKNKGKTHVYDVEIPDRYKSQIGDWDAPLGQQHPRIRQKLVKLAKRYYDEGEDTLKDLTLEELYREIAENTSQETASNMMHRAGLVGHRFFDGESRHAAGMLKYINEFGKEAGVDKYIEKLQSGPLGFHDFSGLRKDLLKQADEATHNYVIYGDDVTKMRGSRIDFD